MNAVIAKCVEVSRRVELSRFVCDTPCTHFNVLPERVEELVEHDNKVEALGTIWVLERDGQMVGWYDEVGMLLAIA